MKANAAGMELAKFLSQVPVTDRFPVPL